VAARPPAFLKALGRRALPDEIRIAGGVHRHVRVFKNDFFAVTALYEGPSGKFVLKVGRQAPFLLLPLSWVGRLLAMHERACLLHLADLDGVPRYAAPWSRTGLLRQFIPGHALQKGERVPDDFHRRLRGLVGAIHARGMAYVDLEKCENVLVGDDGRPYLFDFQISWYLPRRWGGELWAARMLRKWFQAGDGYHLVKLERRTRPDQLSPEALAASYLRPWYIRAYTNLTRPLTLLRRRLLNRLDPRRGPGERGRISA